MSALYIHIPFCKSRCNYCDFYKSTSCSETETFIDALEKEMEYRRDFLANTAVKTVYFGGGTPSLYPPAVFQRIIDKARSLWNLEDVTEITLEANPEDITEEYLDALATTDINRLSLGVQSFIDRDLKLMGRRHTAKKAEDAIHLAQEKGFSNISIDLIFGIPGMTLRDWENCILRAMLLGVQHISAYSLTICDDTVFGQMVKDGKLNLVDDESFEQEYLLAHQILTDGGYGHYEISNYAFNETFRSKHNCSYWTGETYLGLGPSAHSYDGNNRIIAVNNIEKYIAGVGTETIYEKEVLSQNDKYNEFIMTALRTCCGVRREVMAKRFGFQGLLYFEYSADKFLKNGSIVRSGDEYKIPPEKMMISNGIISDLFYIDE